MASAYGVPINGSMFLISLSTLDNPDATFATQITLNSPIVTSVTGDFSPAIAVGDAPVFPAPLIPGTTPNSIFSIAGFTFSPSNEIRGGGGPPGLDAFALGFPIIIDDGPGGFDPTPGLFLLSARPSSSGYEAGALVTSDGFQPKSNVDDSASTLTLFGIALSALGIVFRSKVMV